MSKEQNSLLIHLAKQNRQLNAYLKKRFENELDQSLRDLIRGITYINRLQSKILEREAGIIPVNNFEYSSQGEMISQCSQWIDQVCGGENPWKGRFAEIDGLCVDHAFFKLNGTYHIIYIRLDACAMWQELSMANFGHAVSEDLMNWRVLKPVLPVRPNTWENMHVWAPHIIYYQEKYWMFYTGVNEYACQAISAACSEDLNNWERISDQPLIKPGSWGHWDPKSFSSCRDPFVLHTEEGFYCYYTAHLNQQEPLYCVGIAFSENLKDWQDKGYVVLENSVDTPPESPFVVYRDDTYYLFYTSYKHGTVVATSDRPDDGFVDRQGKGYVVLNNVSASEFLLDDDGQWYMTAITHEPNHFHFIEWFRLYWPDEQQECFRVESVFTKE